MAKKEVTTTTAAGPPASLLAKMEAHADAGTSKAASDNLVPLVYILQKQSPQVEKRDPRYVENAEPGDVWLRNAAQPIIKGDEGMEFQPCYFEISWIEWVPRERGGGFVARHPSDPEHPEKCPVADAVLQRDHQNPSRIKYVRPNNNEIIQTRNHVGFVLNDGMVLPFVIPMQSTGHTISRQWMFDLNSRLIPSGPAAGHSYPTWAHVYRLRTKPRTNAMGTWFTWDVEWDGWASEQQYDRGTILHEAFATGAQVPEAPEADAARAEDQQGPM